MLFFDRACVPIACAADGTVEVKRVDPPAPEGVSDKVTLTEVEAEKLLPVTGDPMESVEDLVQLQDVNAGAVLQNLRLRYAEDEIFTAIGPILITINPYKSLEVCSAEHMSQLTKTADVEGLPPHIFKIAHSAYARMRQTGSACSILISGESGAGKTEACKLCMNSLAEISGSSGASTEAALESGLLLEAFGNAIPQHCSPCAGQYVEQVCAGWRSCLGGGVRSMRRLMVCK